ncbi:VPS10, partial [Symbiodinium sp. CCMP2592]
MQYRESLRDGAGPRAAETYAQRVVEVFTTTLARSGEAVAAELLCDLVLLLPDQVPRHLLRDALAQLCGEEEEAAEERAAPSSSKKAAKAKAAKAAKASSVSSTSSAMLPRHLNDKIEAIPLSRSSCRGESKPSFLASLDAVLNVMAETKEQAKLPLSQQALRRSVKLLDATQAESLQLLHQHLVDAGGSSLVYEPMDRNENMVSSIEKLRADDGGTSLMGESGCCDRRLYRSTNGGETWNDITDYFKVDVPGSAPQPFTAESMSKSPADPNTILVSGNKKTNFISSNRGSSWKKIRQRSQIHTVMFHKTRPSWLLLSTWTSTCNRKDKSSAPAEGEEDGGGPCNHMLYLSRDLGKTFSLVQNYVVQFSWGDPSMGQQDRIYFTHFRKKTGDQPKLYIWSNDVDFAYMEADGRRSTTMVPMGNKFLVSHKFIFVAKVKDVTSQTVNLMVSADGGRSFNAAQLPTEIDEKSYTVLDTSEGLVMLHVNHGAKENQVGNVYISDEKGFRFTLSLPNNVRGTNGDCEFDKVLSLEGVYMANFKDIPRSGDSASSGAEVAKEAAAESEALEGEAAAGTEVDKRRAPKNKAKEESVVRTVISFDKGGVWSYLKPPRVDSTGKQIDCPPDKCWLHLHGITNFHNYAPFYSTENAIGIIMGTGNVGPYLRFEPDQTNTYLSRDGGLTWLEAHKGAFIYEYGDHGGLVVMADDVRKTKLVVFSWNEGQSWYDFELSSMPIEVDNIVTEPNATSTKFLLYGTRGDTGVMYHLNFETLGQPLCKGVWAADSVSSDYASWLSSGTHFFAGHRDSSKTAETIAEIVPEFLLSGDEIATLSAHAITELATAKGNSAKAVKRYLQGLLGIPMYRQRLLAGNLPIRDDASLGLFSSEEVLLVVLPFQKATTRQVKALQVAAALDQGEEMETLLQLPLDPDCVDGEKGREGRSVLGVAASHGSRSCVRLLLEARADANKTTDLFGASPLWAACKGGHLETCRLLLQAGADMEKPAITGTTPLWVAATYGHVETVRFLLRAAADTTTSNNETGATPLRMASEQGHAEAAQLLVWAGAEMDAADKGGMTPLWAAARHGHSETVRMLLQAGADMEKVNGFGTSPLWIASACGHSEVVQLLVWAGADLCATNKQGETSFWIASKCGHLKVMCLLLQPSVGMVPFRRCSTLCMGMLSPIRGVATGAHSLMITFVSCLPWDLPRLVARFCVQATYTRRKQTSECFNGEKFERPISKKNCECTQENFECEVGFTRAVGSMDCKYADDGSIKIPYSCARNDHFFATGYRKVVGDTCEGGWQPQQVAVPCPPKPMSKGAWSVLGALGMLAVVLFAVNY